MSIWQRPVGRIGYSQGAVNTPGSMVSPRPIPGDRPGVRGRHRGHRRARRRSRVEERCTLVNLSEQPVRVESQELDFLQSVVVTDIAVNEVKRGLIVERFSNYEDEAALYEEVKKFGRWPMTSAERRGSKVSVTTYRPRLFLATSGKAWVSCSGAHIVLQRPGWRSRRILPERPDLVGFILNGKRMSIKASAQPSKTRPRHIPGQGPLLRI